MSTNEIRSSEVTSGATVAKVDMKLEVAVIPVSDVDRAKEFYKKLGWRLDADFPFDNGFRVVQFTPPGSGCSVQFGTKITSAAPGSAKGLYLIVSDISAAHDEIASRGIIDQRGVPLRDAWCSVPARQQGRSRQRTSSQSRHLQLLRHIQRPRWQHLAPAGSHNAPSRTRRSRFNFVRLRQRSGKRASPCLCRPRPTRKAHRRRRSKLARLVRRVHRR